MSQNHPSRPMQLTQSPYEVASRIQKAYKLADAVEKLAKQQSVEPIALVEEMDYDAWQALAKLADCNPPSHLTIELINDVLRKRAEDIDADPFEGL